MARCIVCGKEAGYMEADSGWFALAYLTVSTLNLPQEYRTAANSFKSSVGVIEVVPFCSVRVRELVNTPDLKNIWGICPECMNQEGCEE